ncbi:hypothetical protein ANN_03233 [Periplaneta americana]|uniref:Zinc finger PHD-type domain-containing protein n=1 Tax=Periplaneta americana TaxID=6978 RepID=A0ABQ8U039_PERAM|nr:hypothetical protein ANN_03233 [Periplaneta americana]
MRAMIRITRTTSGTIIRTNTLVTIIGTIWNRAEDVQSLFRHANEVLSLRDNTRALQVHRSCNLDMAPSKDVCLVCNLPFFGRQKFLKCAGPCGLRYHLDCLNIGEAEYDIYMQSGSSIFKCKKCVSAMKSTQGDNTPVRPTAPGEKKVISPTKKVVSPSRDLNLPSLPSVDSLSVQVETVRLNSMNILDTVSDILEYVKSLQKEMIELKNENAALKIQVAEIFVKTNSNVLTYKDVIFGYSKRNLSKLVAQERQNLQEDRVYLKLNLQQYIKFSKTVQQFLFVVHHENYKFHNQVSRKSFGSALSSFLTNFKNVQAIAEDVKVIRMNFAVDMLHRIDENNNFLHILFRDEETFHLSGHVNRRVNGDLSLLS